MLWSVVGVGIDQMGGDDGQTLPRGLGGCVRPPLRVIPLIPVDVLLLPENPLVVWDCSHEGVTDDPLLHGRLEGCHGGSSFREESVDGKSALEITVKEHSAFLREDEESGSVGQSCWVGEDPPSPVNV